MSDKLDQIFELQKELDRHIEEDNPALVQSKLGTTLDQRINAKAQAIIHEAVEVQMLTAWKWWKKGQTGIVSDEARQEVLKELVDIKHFVVSATLDLGFTADDFHAGYVGKNKENHSRQERKY